jgi:hypothetical protein
VDVSKSHDVAWLFLAAAMAAAFLFYGRIREKTLR